MRASLVCATVLLSLTIEARAYPIPPAPLWELVSKAELVVVAEVEDADRIVIDDMEQESVLPNKLAPPELVSGDISGLVLGSITGRHDDDERTAFIFRGHAMGDLALASLAYEKARACSAGTEIQA